MIFARNSEKTPLGRYVFSVIVVWPENAFDPARAMKTVLRASFCQPLTEITDKQVPTSEIHPPRAWRILLNTAEECTYTYITVNWINRSILLFFLTPTMFFKIFYIVDFPPHGSLQKKLQIIMHSLKNFKVAFKHIFFVMNMPLWKYKDIT